MFSMRVWHLSFDTLSWSSPPDPDAVGKQVRAEPRLRARTLAGSALCKGSDGVSYLFDKPGRRCQCELFQGRLSYTYLYYLSKRLLRLSQSNYHTANVIANEYVAKAENLQSFMIDTDRNLSASK